MVFDSGISEPTSHELFLTQPRFVGEAALETKFPPGLVCVCTAELTRYKEFLVSYRRLLVPTGSGEFIQTGPYISENREVAVTAMDQNPKLQWLWFLDDDHKFAPDVLLKQLQLAKEQSFDVLGMIYLKRTPPFNPVGAMFSTKDVTHHQHHLPTSMDALSKSGEFLQEIDGNCLGCTSQIKLRAIDWSDVPRAAKVWQHEPALCLGTSGLLIQRHVLEKLSRPIFQIGRIQPHLVLEDIFFSIRCQLAGFKLGMNLEQALGHTGRATWWPVRDAATGQWAVGVDQDVMSPLAPRPSPEGMASRIVQP